MASELAIWGQVAEEIRVQALSLGQLYAVADGAEDDWILSLVAGVVVYLHDPARLLAHTVRCAVAWSRADARADREVARGCLEQAALADEGRRNHRALKAKKEAAPASTEAA